VVPITESRRASLSDIISPPAGGKSPAARIGVLIMIAALVLLCALSALERSRTPLPAGLSCILPSPRACLAELESERDNVDGERLAQRSAALAHANPADAQAQAFHALILEQSERPDEAYSFFLGSARLGWREEFGQLYAYLTAAQSGDNARAALHLEALLKLNRELARTEELLKPMLDSPELRDVFARRLATQPDYLRSFLISFSDDTDSLWRERIDLLAEARGYGLKLDPETYSNILWSLYRKDPWKALEYWAALHGSGDWEKGLLAWNTAGQGPAIGTMVTPFSWYNDADRRPPIQPEQQQGKNVLAVSRDLTSNAQKLATIAVPLRSGSYPVRWQVTGRSGKLFLSAGCSRGQAAELTDVTDLGGGLWSAVLVSDEPCAMPEITIHKATGVVARGTAIGGIAIGGIALLD
jgi:hypothetical protein